MAIHTGPNYEVHVRVAGREGEIYIDLANEDWQAIRITANGWEVVNQTPVRFRRASGMRPLPIPTRKGSFDQLWGLLNVRPSDRPLVKAWCVQAIRDHGPYPVLAIYGEHGSAKSTGARVLRSIIDPNEAPLRAPPKEIRDLAIGANNSHVIAFDNLSGLSGWFSDALCTLSTGGGFATRVLYADDEERIFSYQRPCIINGIAEVAVRPDLVDRLVPLNLEPISDSRRMTEAELNQAFSELHPGVLGALLDAVSTALGRIDSIELAQKPRMADFATWVVAAEPALDLSEDDFLSAYMGARADAIGGALDTSTVAQWLRDMISDGASYFEGAMTELYERGAREERIRRASDWPKNARGLSAELRRLAPALRTIGVDVEFRKDSGRGRQRIVIVRSVSGPDFASSASGASGDQDADAEPTQVLPRPVSDTSDGADAKSRAEIDAEVCPGCGLEDECFCDLDPDDSPNLIHLDFTGVKPAKGRKR